MDGVQNIDKADSEINLKDPQYYFNREISLIDFNERVLLEAENEKHPLLERLKFVSIFSSNMDEFFMIRVAGLKNQIAAGALDLSYDGKAAAEQVVEIRQKLDPLYKWQEKILNEDIYPKLRDEGVFFHDFEDLTIDEKREIEDYYFESIFPVLTPLSLDSAHPFPRLLNCGLNVAFLLEDASNTTKVKRIAFLEIPRALKRIYRLKRDSGYHIILIEQIVKEFAWTLFPGLKIEASNTFKVTRDADIEIADDEAEDLLDEISEQIKNRRAGTQAVRLEVSANMPEKLVNLLMKALELEPIDVYVHNRHLHLPDFMELMKLDAPRLKDEPFVPYAAPQLQAGGVSAFDAIKKGDILVHHPFDSFTNSVLKFINEAAEDKKVVAIKITLYRTGSNSAVVAALKRAAEEGKQVAAFVELKARFDEENNIIWAKELERVGVHVVYGVLGLKTHCKICIVVRQEGDKLKTYLHLATGNYNQTTARLYTDVGLLTAREEFSLDAIHLFNYLTGYSYNKDWKRFIVAPIDLRRKVIEFIRREAELSSPENPGLIFAKMNSLAHREVIPELYKASQKGVRIKLLVRGICCLRPDVPGVSENIEVRSVLGRFLEHSRIFYFKNGGDDEVYLSSADWMSRNLNKRVELMFPALDEKIKKKLLEILFIYWKDNKKSWRLQYDGSYERLPREEDQALFSAQEYFLKRIKTLRKAKR